jgi:exopolysaccharide biosynthesis polyprenyl glycosylphosphotransferase
VAQEPVTKPVLRRWAAIEPGEETLSERDGDVRSARPYFLSRASATGFVRRLGSILALVLIDLSGVALGLYAALTARELWVGHVPPLWGLLWEAESSWLPFIMLVTALVFWRNGLYGPRERRGGFGRILSSVVLAGIFVVAFAVGVGHEFSTYLLVPTTVVLTAALIGLFRGSYEAVSAELMRLAGVRRRALIVGDAEERQRVGGALTSAGRGIDYEIVGAVGADSAKGELRDLPKLLRARSVDEIVLADSALTDKLLLEIVDLAHRAGVKVRIAPKTSEILVHRAQYAPEEGLPLFELRPPVFAGTDWVVKRAFDLFVSALFLLVGLPVWLIIAAVIKLTSSGPVLYPDRRVGLNEQEFSMLKFRTMYADAAEQQKELEKLNEADGPLFKLRRDPRVTGFGRLLRRYSLDEIPQLLNVLRGEMSLVGPRPLPLRDYRRLEPWHRKRYLVLPGMTGLWQISGRSNLGFDDLVRLDFSYLENWSVWLDVSILLRTIPAVLTRRGAY